MTAYVLGTDEGHVPSRTLCRAAVNIVYNPEAALTRSEKTLALCSTDTHLPLGLYDEVFPQTSKQRNIRNAETCADCLLFVLNNVDRCKKRRMARAVDDEFITLVNPTVLDSTDIPVGRVAAARARMTRIGVANLRMNFVTTMAAISLRLVERFRSPRTRAEEKLESTSLVVAFPCTLIVPRRYFFVVSSVFVEEVLGYSSRGLHRLRSSSSLYTVLMADRLTRVCMSS